MHIVKTFATSGAYKTISEPNLHDYTTLQMTPVANFDVWVTTGSQNTQTE